MSFISVRKFLLTVVMAAVCLVYLPAVGAGSSVFAQQPDNHPASSRHARSLETSEQGISNPAGLSWSPSNNTFYVVSGDGSDNRGSDKRGSGETELFQLSPHGDLGSSIYIAAQIEDPINMAFDGEGDHLLIFNASTNQLIEVQAGPDGVRLPDTLVYHEIQGIDLQDPQGMTVDTENGHLYILDAGRPSLVRIEPDANGSFGHTVASQIDLPVSADQSPRGLAYNPVTEHLYLLNFVEDSIYELTVDGQIVGTRDISEMELRNPQGMVFAQSADLTDAPETMSLYIADSVWDAKSASGNRDPKEKKKADGKGKKPNRNGDIVELSFAETEPSPREFAVAAASTNTYQSSLVQTIDASQWSPPSPDSAGITYLPGSDRLLVSDSEVNEMPLYAGINLFETSRSGVLLAGQTSIPFAKEPTGVSLNPANQHLFVSDDDADKVFEVDPGSDGLHGTADDSVTFLNARLFDSHDAEGVAFSPETGDLFLVDGTNREVYRVSPGPNGVFDGISPDGDDQVTSFDTAVHDVLDPEGIAIGDNGYLTIVGRGGDFVAEMTTEGTLLRVIDISAAGAYKAAGLVYAPGSINPSEKHLFMVDRGVDNNKDPDENDGKIYELSLPPLTANNVAPTVDAGPDQTITSGSSLNLDGTVTHDGLPTSSVNIVWSHVSGPGLVTFADANAEDTAVSFSLSGIYVVRLTADDGELAASDETTVSVTESSGLLVVESRIMATKDDAEEWATGNVKRYSADLELVFDAGGHQTVGLRFNDLGIPPDATIVNAYVQFKADETDADPTSLTIQGEAADNTVTFQKTAFSLSSRPRTQAAVSWSPPPWPTVGASSIEQRTPNIASVIQEIVGRPGWTSGNSLSIIITGSGERVAESYNGDAAGAPLLHVEFSTEPGN